MAQTEAAPDGDRWRAALLGIGNRGNQYLHKNLTHGARSALLSLVERETPLGEWARGLLTRAHKDIVVVALAITTGADWLTVPAHGQVFDAGYEDGNHMRESPERRLSRRRVAEVCVR